MSCQQWVKRGYLYLSHELSEEEKQHFETHMSECRYCQAQYQEGQKLWNDLEFLKQVKPSKKIRQKIQVYASEFNKNQKTSRIEKFFSELLPKRPLFALSYAVIILLIGLAVFQYRKAFFPDVDSNTHLAWEDNFYIEASQINERFEHVELGDFLKTTPGENMQSDESWLSPMTDDLIDLRQNMKDVMSTLYGI